MYKLLLVDDTRLFVEGLSALLGHEVDMAVVAQTTSAEQARAVARDTQLDAAVIDVVMPSTSGITLAVELSKIQPECRILGLSVVNEPGVIAAMLRAGARGFAHKDQPVAEIIDAIRRILRGERYLPPTISREMIATELAHDLDDPTARLSRREHEIFELLIHGFRNEEIASRLFISRRTVETHRYRITRKISARSILEMQRVAVRYKTSSR